MKSPVNIGAGGMLGHFGSLTEAADSVHFYDKGDYYITLGNGARRIANDIFHSSSVLKFSKGNVPLVSVSQKLFSSVVVRLLLKEKARVFVWCSEDLGKTWTNNKRGSPGLLGDFSSYIQEQNGDSDGKEPCLACLYVKQDKGIGLVVVNTIMDYLGVCQLQTDMEDIPGVLDQYGIEEVIICSSQIGLLGPLLETSSVKITERPANEFNRYKGNVFGTNNHEDLILNDCSQIFGVEKSEVDAGILNTLLSDGESSAARPVVLAFSCIVQYLRDNGHNNIFRVFDVSPQNRLYIDHGAIDALNLQELYKILNTCRTPMGSRLLKRMILMPSMDLDEIMKRQQTVSYFYDDIELRDTVREHILKRCVDGEKLAVRLYQKYLQSKGKEVNSMDQDLKSSLRDLSGMVSVYKVLRVAEKLANSCSVEGSLGDLCKDLKRYLKSCNPGMITLENIIDIESLGLQGGSYTCLVSPKASPKLLQLHEKLEGISSKIVKECRTVASMNNVDNLVIKAHKKGSSGTMSGCIDSEEAPTGKSKKRKGKPKLTMYLEKSSVHGTYFRVTKKDYNSFFKNKKRKSSKKTSGGNSGFRIITSQKDGTKFVSNGLDDLNKAYIESYHQYEEVQSAIISRTLSSVGPHLPDVLKIIEQIAAIDVYATLADIAASKDYCKPVFNETGEMIIENGRHAVVEGLDDINFVPNDCVLNSAQKNSPGNCSVIFGPNMGGKSTYIKSNALIQLMAQMGGYVPASKASLPVCDAILARVGANDNKEIGSSTFMVEMRDMATILRRATSKSFVIVDEIGRGTSTYDGFGLAWALIRHLADNIKCKLLVATHFFELSELATRKDVATINNYHVEATVNKETGNVIMLYRVEPGATSKSYGVACAKMAGFPQKVVEEADRIMNVR